MMNGQIIVIISDGLEQAENFIKQLQAHTNLIFIFIFTDNSASKYAPLELTNLTSMPVFEVESQLYLEKNSVYILPYNKSVKLADHYILSPSNAPLTEPSHRINIFLESIAKEIKQNCCVLFLSKIDDDVLTSVEAVRKTGCIIFQQISDISESGSIEDIKYIYKYEIEAELLKWRDNNFENMREVSPGLRQIFTLLHSHTKYDFSAYKLSTIYRRINRQMQANHFDNVGEYAKFLSKDSLKLDALFDDLLIGVTSFFRDADAFSALKNILIQRILKHKTNKDILRIWIPGCSSGEEAYSIAIVALESLLELNLHCQVQIFATDIDKNALDIARSGVYSLAIERNVSKERLKRFFTRDKNHYKVKSELRNLLTFGIQNIISDPPFTKLDMLCCRNLLIYLNTDVQKKLLPIFHYSLASRGILFLGTSEAIAGSVDLFKLLMKKWKIYERRDVDSFSRVLLNFPVVKTPKDLFAPSAKSLIDEKTTNSFLIAHELLEDFLPPAVVINKKGEVLYTHGQLNAYLKLPPSKNIINIFDILPSKLKEKVIPAVHKVFVERNTLSLDHLEFSSKGPKVAIRLRLSPINIAEHAETYVGVIFENVISSEQIDTVHTKYSNLEKMAKRIISLEQELQYNKENLQANIEELQSNNEELQSTNEELQSTNEEIETSKEELLSMNEELIIVNAELQSRIDQLASLGADMNNLFHSTQIMAVFLDKDLAIKRFTPLVTKLINLLNNDIGRPLKHLTTKFKNTKFSDDADEVINTLSPKYFEAETVDNEWFQIHIIPYRNVLDEVDGAVITFTNITEHKNSILDLEYANSKLKEGSANIETLLNSVKTPALFLDKNLNVISANQLFCQVVQMQFQEITDKNICSILHGDDVDEFENILRKIADGGLDVLAKQLKIDNLFGSLILTTVTKLYYPADEAKLMVIFSDPKE